MTAIKLPVRVEESLCVGLAGEPEWMIVDATGCMVEEFSTRNRAERRAAALNAQERAAEPAACSVCGSATCEGTHMTRDRDYSANEAHMAAALAPAAAPWESEQLCIVRDALSILADKLSASCEDAYHDACLAAFAACDRIEGYVAEQRRALKYHKYNDEKNGRDYCSLMDRFDARHVELEELKLTLGIAKEQKAMLMEREDDLTRALDMQRQATEEAQRRAEGARAEAADRKQATDLALEAARGFEQLLRKPCPECGAREIIRAFRT